MKVKYVSYVFLLILHITCGFAQTDSIQPRLRISSFSFAFGVLTNQVPATSQNDYRKIAPQNSLINTDLSGYTYGTGILNFNGYFNMNLGLNRLNKKSKTYNLQEEYRVGMRFYPEDILPVSYHQTTQLYYDSLMSGNTMVYNVSVDSTISYNYGISSSNVMFDFGAIYQSNPLLLLQGYVGYNIGMGTTFQSSANAFKSTSISVKSQTSTSYKNISPILEGTPLRNSFVLNASVVWGASLRFSKTKKFWNKFHLNLEGRFGANSQNIQNYGTFTRVFISGHFGFKFLLH